MERVGASRMTDGTSSASPRLLMGCTMWALSSLFYLAPLLVLKSGSSLSAYAPAQLQAMALLFIKLNALAYDIAFWLQGW